MKNIENNSRQEWLKERIDYLAEFMTPERRATLEKTLASRTYQMTILSENTFHSQNASALMRHCEAFGLQHMHAIEELCDFKTYCDIVRGTDKWVDLTRYTNTGDAIRSLKEQGYRIVATTPHLKDSTPESFDVEAGKFALVFGTEHAGISQQIIDEADEFLQIPMCGMVESLNVSASAAILIYMLSQRLRDTTTGWEIAPLEQHEILYRWMKSSVRDSERILKRKFSDI
ncbi:MAG: RNA methyltransferase [Rikenellaceae bacterium]